MYVYPVEPSQSYWPAVVRNLRLIYVILPLPNLFVNTDLLRLASFIISAMTTQDLHFFALLVAPILVEFVLVGQRATEIKNNIQPPKISVGCSADPKGRDDDQPRNSLRKLTTDYQMERTAAFVISRLGMDNGRAPMAVRSSSASREIPV
mgnify:FL=1